MVLSDLPDDAIVGGLFRIRNQERSARVQFLHFLAELNRRKTFLALGFPSLHAYCTDALGLSKASTFRRTTAAKLLARFPVVAAYLDDGRLNLTTLFELREVLDEAHVVEILDRAAGCTEDQVRELVATLRPQAPPPDLLSRLPSSQNHSGGSGPEPPAGREVGGDDAASAKTGAAPAPAPATPPAPPPAPVPAIGPAGRLEPIAPDRHVLRVTVSGAFVADLESVRMALSHKMPGASLEQVLHECVRTTLKTIDRRRCGAGKKTSRTPPPRGSRLIPAGVRHEVSKRDEGQCTFVAPDGRRCRSRFQLEFHHHVGWAMGGEATAANISLRCRPHNVHAAEKDYGAELVARRIASARIRRRRHAQQEPSKPARPRTRAPNHSNASPSTPRRARRRRRGRR